MHRVWQDGETAFVPGRVLTKAAGHAALQEGFERFFFFCPTQVGSQKSGEAGEMGESI